MISEKQVFVEELTYICSGWTGIIEIDCNAFNTIERKGEKIRDKLCFIPVCASQNRQTNEKEREKV